MSKNILILNGHPNKGSFCAALAESYLKGADKSDATVTLVNLRDLKFDATLVEDYNTRLELEPDLVKIQEQITAANHLVFVYPNWWSNWPALLKGFVDRVFIPEFGFRYLKGKPMPQGLLKGKTARLIVTMDTPPWFYKLVYKSAGHNSMRRSTLKFCGIKPVKITNYSPARKASAEKREAWLKQTEKLGLNNK